MTDIRRVKLNWTGAAVNGPAGTNFYFTVEAGTDQDCVDNVEAWVAQLDVRLHGDLSWATDSGVEYFDVVTGAISSIGSTTPTTGTGTGGSQRLPFATQGLISWRSGAFVGGREIRGRTFVPGMMEENNDAGAPIAQMVTSLNNAAAALLAFESTVNLIWSPTKNTAAAITSGTGWSQWASLRSRRD